MDQENVVIIGNQLSFYLHSITNIGQLYVNNNNIITDLLIRTTS